MMAHFNLCLFTLLFAGVVVSSRADCDFQVVAEQLKKLIQDDFGTHIPLSQKELDSDCSKAKTMKDKIVKLITPCVPKEFQSLLPMALQGVDDFVKAICTDGSDFQKLYLKEAACFDKTMPADLPCVKTAAAELLPILQKIDISKLCCPVEQFNYCTGQVAAATCGADAKKFIDETFTKLKGQTFPALCGKTDCTGWFTGAPTGFTRWVAPTTTAYTGTGRSSTPSKRTRATRKVTTESSSTGSSPKVTTESSSTGSSSTGSSSTGSSSTGSSPKPTGSSSTKATPKPTTTAPETSTKSSANALSGTSFASLLILLCMAYLRNH